MVAIEVMKNGKVWLLAALGVAMSLFFATIMRPPGGQSSPPGQDLPWQVTVSQDGAALTVFGLTLGESTLQDAVNKLGRRYELGVFEDSAGHLSLEGYFRDAVVGRLNARLVLSARLPDSALAALKTHAGKGEPTADQGRRYLVTEADQHLALNAVITAITYLPVVKFDAELVRQRFGEPAERVLVQDGAHWLYPALGIDLLLGDNGGVLLQYTSPAEFEQRLRAPLSEIEN